MAYIQINDKAPVQEQLRQLKTQIEILLDSLDSTGNATLTFDDLTEEQIALLKGKDGEDAPVDTPIADIYIDAIIV